MHKQLEVLQLAPWLGRGHGLLGLGKRRGVRKSPGCRLEEVILGHLLHRLLCAQAHDLVLQTELGVQLASVLQAKRLAHEQGPGITELLAVHCRHVGIIGHWRSRHSNWLQHLYRIIRLLDQDHRGVSLHVNDRGIGVHVNHRVICHRNHGHIIRVRGRDGITAVQGRRRRLCHRAQGVSQAVDGRDPLLHGHLGDQSLECSGHLASIVVGLPPY